MTYMIKYLTISEISFILMTKILNSTGEGIHIVQMNQLILQGMILTHIHIQLIFLRLFPSIKHTIHLILFL